MFETGKKKVASLSDWNRPRWKGVEGRQWNKWSNNRQIRSATHNASPFQSLSCKMMSDNLSFVLRGIEDVVYEQRPIPESTSLIIQLLSTAFIWPSSPFQSRKTTSLLQSRRPVCWFISLLMDLYLSCISSIRNLRLGCIHDWPLLLAMILILWTTDPLLGQRSHRWLCCEQPYGVFEILCQHFTYISLPGSWTRIIWGHFEERVPIY